MDGKSEVTNDLWGCWKWCAACQCPSVTPLPGERAGSLGASCSAAQGRRRGKAEALAGLCGEGFLWPCYFHFGKTACERASKSCRGSQLETRVGEGGRRGRGGGI